MRKQPITPLTPRSRRLSGRSYNLGQNSGLTLADGTPTGGLFGTAVATMGMLSTAVYVLRVFPLCALVPRMQGSSCAVATVYFVWRGHAKTPTTRAGPWPDFALRLE